MLFAYIIEEDGQRWVRIEDAVTGLAWDEPVSDFERILDLTAGGPCTLRRKSDKACFAELNPTK